MCSEDKVGACMCAPTHQGTVNIRKYFQVLTRVYNKNIIPESEGTRKIYKRDKFPTSRTVPSQYT